MIFNSSIFLKCALVLLILNTPLLSMEPIFSAELEKGTYNSVLWVQFLKKMIEMTGGDYASEGGEHFLFTTYFGRFTVSEFAPKVFSNGGVLSRYSYVDVPKDDWDTFMNNGRSLHKLDYSRDGVEVPLCNDFMNSALMYHNEGSIWYMYIYKQGGWKDLQSSILNDDNFKTYMTNPANRMQFYIDLVTMWKTLAEQNKRICVSSPYNISLHMVDKEETMYSPMFRNPEMAVGMKEKCHDFDNLWSSRSVIEGDVGKMMEYTSKVEVFNLTKLITYIEAMIAYSLASEDSNGNDILDVYSAFEMNVRAERIPQYFGNAKLKEEKNYVFEQALHAFDSKEIPNVSDEAKPAIREVFEALYVNLKEGQRQNNTVNGRPSLDDLHTAFNGYLETIQGAMAGRRRNVLLV